MTKAEARRCVEAIKNTVSLRQLLVELEDRRGGKPSVGNITACLVSEFRQASTSPGTKVGRIENIISRFQLEPTWNQLRPLSEIVFTTRYQPTITKAHQLAGDAKLTATHVAQAVNERLNPSFAKRTSPSKYKAGDLVLYSMPSWGPWNNTSGMVAIVHQLVTSHVCGL